MALSDANYFKHLVYTIFCSQLPQMSRGPNNSHSPLVLENPVWLVPAVGRGQDPPPIRTLPSARLRCFIYRSLIASLGTTTFLFGRVSFLSRFLPCRLLRHLMYNLYGANHLSLVSSPCRLLMTDSQLSRSRLRRLDCGLGSRGIAKFLGFGKEMLCLIS